VSGSRLSADLRRQRRDRELVQGLARRLRELRPNRPLRFMHVCGTHEHEIAHHGLRRLMPDWLEVIAGPGCPVCVCPVSELDLGARLGLEHGAVVTSFGDLIRVPARVSLAQARERGADVRVVTSAAEAAQLARRMPQREVVFLAVGFETTACTTAAAALADPPPNLSFVVSHRLVPPALQALLSAAELELDGFLLPGHVTAVEGVTPYRELGGALGLKMAVAGFEPSDILDGLLALVQRVLQDRPGVDNCYPRAVRAEGNPAARAAIRRVFEPVDAPWRGLGVIPGSGLGLRAPLRAMDARVRFGIEPDTSLDVPDPGCRCDEILLGLCTPADCPLFGGGCTPEHPHGACMVSAEGTCAAWHRHPQDPRLQLVEGDAAGSPAEGQ